MAEITYSPHLATSLSGKTIIVLGGAQGIGASTVRLLHSHGARVFLGDISAAHGTALASECAGAEFHRVDVAEYSDLVSLFESAYAATGRVDGAICCAAVGEPAGLFEPATLNREGLLSRRDEGEKKVARAIEVNLIGVVQFARVALGYINSSRTKVKEEEDGEGFTPSITLVSSIAGITPAPGLFTYSSAKHGIIGLTRALAPMTPTAFSTRVNAICPWATDTQLLAAPVKSAWIAENMPMNTPDDVARQIVQCAVDTSLNGRVVYVAGGRGFDTEAGVVATQGTWMGEENCAIWNRGQEILGSPLTTWLRMAKLIGTGRRLDE